MCIHAVNSHMRVCAFTLLELLVALAIMVIAGVAIMQAMSQSLLITHACARRTRAAQLAQMKMEEFLQNPDLLTEAQQEGDFGDLFPDFQWHAEVVESPIQDMQLLRVTVVWQDGVRERSFTLSTLIGPEELTSAPPTQGRGEDAHATEEGGSASKGTLPSEPRGAEPMGGAPALR
ncbi:MAG TPA: type II secretion system protein [Armatimonadetes bacterium]|nr:type II secretion system protein [Armatimonadota bacterium]